MMTIPFVAGVISFSISLIGGKAKLFSMVEVTVFTPVITAKAV